jgi:hypothetical protein
MTEVGAALFGASNLLSMGGLGNCLGREKAKDLKQSAAENGGENPPKTGVVLRPARGKGAGLRITMLVASLLFCHFDIEGDGYGVADHFVAAREAVGHVDHAEILAIDFGGGGGAAAGAHSLDDFGGAGDVEGDLFGDAVQGKVAGHFGSAFAAADNFAGLECDAGVFGYVKEVIAFEVVVAVLHAGVQGVDVNACGDCRFGDVLVVEIDCAGKFCEFALDVGDAQMADGKLSVGVGGV